MTKPTYCFVTISRPMGNDPGTIEEAHYVLEGADLVVLTDSVGTPLVRNTVLRRRGEPFLTRWERKIAPHEDAWHAARELLWAKYRATRKGGDFNRPLGPMPWSRSIV
jgi:hypothetical protein